MKWIITYLSSSIGKKQIVAITGIFLFLFLIAHLSGNFLLFVGKDAFNKYADSLASLGGLLYVIETALALLFLTHIAFALKVNAESHQARPEKYAVKNWAGRRSLGSSTMPITGGIFLIFLLSHIWHFRVAKELTQNKGRTLYDLVVNLFHQGGYVAWYVFGIIILGIHLSHGLQSAVRTLGLGDKKYTTIAEMLSIVLAIVISLGYISLPIYFYGNHLLSGGLN